MVMSKKTRVKSKTSAFLGALFFLPPLVIFLLWIITGIDSPGAPEFARQNQFIEFFPGWMQNFKMIHVFSVLCCIAVLYFATGSFKKHQLWIRISMMVMVMLSIIILLYDFVQLI